MTTPSPRPARRFSSNGPINLQATQATCTTPRPEARSPHHQATNRPPQQHETNRYN